MTELSGAINKLFAGETPKFDPKAGRILVTSANGVVAHRVASRLLAADYPDVRVGLSDPTTSVAASDLYRKGAHVVQFDWDKEAHFGSALNGVKSVFVAVPHHENTEEHFEKFIMACKSAGVKHVVKLSFYHALSRSNTAMKDYCHAVGTNDPFLKVPLVQMHSRIDMRVVKCGMDYTLLFASHFMSNPIVYQADSLRKMGQFSGASHGKGVNYVSPNDVAEVAVRALVKPKDHHRIGYTLTGPASITDERVAELLSRKLNKKVEYVDKPLEAYKEAASPTDWGPNIDLAYLEYAKASGAEQALSFVSNHTEKVCGHPAETFEDYLNAEELMTPQELEYLKA
jgi:NAD(P)H dehydrogenase (quinone)